MQKKQTIYKICITAVLCALAIAIKRFFSVNMSDLSIGITFFPILVCAMSLGPVYGGVCGGVADLVGAIFFPHGPYFPGFTITAFMSGFAFGFVKKTKREINFFFMCLLIFFVEQLICAVLLDSLWISILSGSPYIPYLIKRSIEATIMLPIQIFSAFIIKNHILNPIQKMIK